MSCNPAIAASPRVIWFAKLTRSAALWGITDRGRHPVPSVEYFSRPAVWSPRAQCDKQAYRLKMREVAGIPAESQDQAGGGGELIIEVRVASTESPSETDDSVLGTRYPVLGVGLRDGRTWAGRPVIITTALFLNG